MEVERVEQRWIEMGAVFVFDQKLIGRVYFTADEEVSK